MRALLPFVFILICPLMMLFMMRGMHGHRSDNAHGAQAFDEHGTPRRGQSVASLTGERDRLEQQLATLDAEIGATTPRADQSPGSAAQAAPLSR